MSVVESHSASSASFIETVFGVVLEGLQATCVSRSVCAAYTRGQPPSYRWIMCNIYHCLLHHWFYHPGLKISFKNVGPWRDTWWDAVICTASFIDHFFTLVKTQALISCMRVVAIWLCCVVSRTRCSTVSSAQALSSVCLIYKQFFSAPSLRTSYRNHSPATMAVIQSSNHICKLVNFRYRKYTSLQTCYDPFAKRWKGESICVPIFFYVISAHIEHCALVWSSAIGRFPGRRVAYGTLLAVFLFHVVLHDWGMWRRKDSQKHNIE